MAHKTNSQEHFKMHLYRFKVRFKAAIRPYLHVKDHKKAKFLATFVKSNLPVFETNFIYATYAAFSYQFTDAPLLCYKVGRRVTKR